MPPSRNHTRAWIYILASRGHGTLYIGVTTNLPARLWQHQTGSLAGFTKTYRVIRLVYVEQFRRVDAAIERERQLKGWVRRRKLALIEAVNPLWRDLAGNHLNNRVDPSLRSG